MIVRYLSSGCTVFKSLCNSQWSKTVANEELTVILIGRWNSSKNSINWNLSIDIFTFSFFHLPCLLSLLYFIYFLYVFSFCSIVSVSVNALNVYRRLIIMILDSFFDDGDWDHYINRQGTFWGLLGSLWLIKLNLPWFGFSPKRKGWIWRWTWL
jgi:hypothetical protein